MFSHLKQIAEYEQKNGTCLLDQIRHGIEKEGLRVTLNGDLSRQGHPSVLGATLTHPYITTDYSEALLEFITPVFSNITDALSFMEDLHVFTSRHMDNEHIWCSSMPCHLQNENDIPVAQYGTSNIGQMKQVYREGLARRYGKPMQTIAGIHYNFSLPENFWTFIDNQHHLSDQISEGYFRLIRNFNRHSWLLMYLFGSSPAMDRSFFPEHCENLEPLGDDTLYLPFATSLRMSDIGYNNQVQSALNICYNNLDEYVKSLKKAIRTPYPAYEKTGIKQDDQYIQLSTSILQIENEYYSNIRPKRVGNVGEKPINALADRGVEYIEVRCLDINPMQPLGIDEHTARFMDVFLLHCAMGDPHTIPDKECHTLKSNFTKTVNEGRKPGLLLDIYNEGLIKPVFLTTQAECLLESMLPVARALDETCNGNPHTQSLEQQQAKSKDASLTPSSQILESISHHQSFLKSMLSFSSQHYRDFIRTPFSMEREKYFLQLGEQSIRDREKIEADDTISFDEYLKNYFSD